MAIGKAIRAESRAASICCRAGILHRAPTRTRLISHMKLISVNVGLPRLFSWQGQTFKTGIFKKSVSARVMLRKTNLDGDRQADLSVHGGPDKAVYGYPIEHAAAWNAEIPALAVTAGSFGEN